MRSEEEVKRAIDLYSDTVRRICFIHLKNYADTEDIFQTVFLKYAQSSVDFKSNEHEKAWIIRVAINACKDLLKSFFRSHTVSLDELVNLPAQTTQNHREVLEAVISLPKKYRIVIYLFYFEDYSAVQIGKILKLNVNTVYTRLSRARDMLREELEGESLWETV